MPHEIPPRLQRRRNNFFPQTRRPVPSTKRLLEPHARLNPTLLQPPLANLKPRRRARVKRRAVIARIVAVREPRDHRPDGVHPVRVDGGEALAGRDGDVGPCWGAGRVA